MKARLRVPKSVFVPLISVFALLVIFVGGGVAYTWYAGRQSDDKVSTDVVEAPVETQALPLSKPMKPAPDANVGVSVQLITSPVAPGANASINVKTTPGADCTIVVEYNKIPAKDSGLIPKKADEYGVVSWTWTVAKTAPLGEWPAKVTCAYGEKSAVVHGDFLVELSKAQP